MVNHLYRGSVVDSRRLDQATALNEWAQAQTLPVIAVGDYNFDYDLDPGESSENYNKGLGNMIAGNVFQWIEPEVKIKTHDSYYNSILDFIFLRDTPGTFTAISKILQKDGDFPDDNRTPDHRPVMGIFTIDGELTISVLKEKINRQIIIVNEELEELKTLVDELPE